MHTNPLTPNRYGALALGLSTFLFAVFPFVRPFFPLDPSSPAETLAAASPAITSTPWIGAHMGLVIAFVLLVYGVLALYAQLASSHIEPRARRAMMWSLAGIVLIMPMLGVEVHILPILGRLYLTGKPVLRLP